MNRRTLMVAGGAAAAAMPLALTSARADATSAAKLPMLRIGTLSKQMSQRALDRIESDALRQFAELEIAEITAIEAAFGATGPAPLTDVQEDELQRLEVAEAPDLLFLEAQIAVHQAALPIAKDYAASGDDPMAMGAAAVAVPSIASHLAMLAMIRSATA